MKTAGPWKSEQRALPGREQKGGPTWLQSWEKGLGQMSCGISSSTGDLCAPLRRLCCSQAPRSTGPESPLRWVCPLSAVVCS